MSAAYFIGLMSGTSIDGVDGVLADFSDGRRPRIIARASLAMPQSLRSEFLALNITGTDELVRAALAANQLARLYADTVHQLLALSRLNRADVQAIGAHGQTVRHDPAAGYTIQLNNPALLAELAAIDVIADFRSRDVAAGGQGAPLVPAFHQALFGCDHARAVLNLGGIANLTLLQPAQAVRGFDTGPANVLLDSWCQRHTGALYDSQGLWAATGTTQAGLLDALLADPWLAEAPPKSTGRDLFNDEWLARRLAAFGSRQLSPPDVQATLQSLTVHSIASCIERHAPAIEEVLVCGGGALNTGLVNELEKVLGRPVRPTSEFGVPVESVEALAFAWLAQAHLGALPAGLPSVTGARHASVLGCRYPA